MSRILSRESRFFEEYLFDRYDTILGEARPNGSFLPFRLTEEPLLLPDMLAVGQPELEEFHRHWLDITRLEPENPYVVHTSVPSARGLQSNLMLLAIRAAGRKLWFVYLKQEQQFAFVREEPDVSPQGKSYDCYAVYNHRTVGRYYGRFGFLLSLLDAGHQLHHFERLASAFRLGGVETEFLPQAAGILPVCESGVPMLRLSLEPPRTFELREPAYAERIIGRSAPQEQPGERAFLDLLDGLRDDREQVVRHGTGEKVELEPYLERVRARTSLQSHEGFGFFRERKLPLEPLAERLSGEAKRGDLDILLIDPQTNSALRVGDGMRFPNPFGDLNRLLHDSTEYLDPASASFVVLTLLKREDGMTDKRRLYAYVRSAEAMSEAALYFADCGLASRCLRNLDDRYVLERLDGYEQVTYLQIAGENPLNRKLRL